MNTADQSENDDILLQTVQSLVEQEQKLTTLLEKHKPLLTLPTPQTLSDVDEILALARTYSTRTSAPPGWNPSLPVVHFATPNPLPHQLRQGALGAMQLKLVRDERKLKRRRKKEEEEMEILKKQREEEKKKVEESSGSPDPKKKEVEDHYRMEDDDKKRIRRERKDRHHHKENQPKTASDAPAPTMNLSDSSSSSGSDDSDDDDSMEE
jgi:hypothetical protein